MRILFLILLLCFSFLSDALASSINFSPYADMTINTHWNSETQSLEPMDLNSISQKAGIKSYHLAFITDAGSCLPAWGSQSTYSVVSKWGSHLTDRLHQHNIDFDISLGGANGNDLSQACTLPQLIDALNLIISTYHPKGLDFDIENGTANVPKTMQALKEIQKNYPDLNLSFTLPVMPEGLTSTGEEIVKQAKLSDLNFAVNIMAMDYGPAYPNDMGTYAIQAANNLFTFLKQLYPTQADLTLWKRIELTPMIGVNDVNVEQFTLKNADDLRNFSQQVGLGKLSMWSIARDLPCPDQSASPICSGNHLQNNPYEFSAKFMGIN